MIDYDTFMQKALADAERSDYSYGGKKPEEPCFYVQWDAGGMSGGSCWGDEATRHDGGEPKDLEPLMELLDDLNISLRHANQILAAVEKGEFCDNGYYGNYTDYGYKLITVSKVHKMLVEFGYVAPKP